MPNRLEIPSDLDSLIEKREESDRRKNNESSVSPTEGDQENSKANHDGEERRSGKDRRQGSN